MNLRTIDIAIISIAAIALACMFVQFDGAIISGAIAAITTVLGVNRYLEGRPGGLQAPGAAGAPVQ